MEISCKEQLSIGLRFFHEKSNVFEEEFVGYVEHERLDVKSIVKTNKDFVTHLNLNLGKCKCMRT